MTTDPIYLTDGTNIDDLFTTYPNTTSFIFQNGNYYMTNILKIKIPNISFIGATSSKYVHIFQTNPDRDGIAVSADNFTMKNISVHDTFDGRIPLTVANCDSSTVTGCYFYGSSTTFAIYYAGPKVATGQPTLDAYSSNNLDQKHNFSNNVVYSKWSGDAVSFSLQHNSVFSQNIIRGGKVAVYMCKKTKVHNNVIYDSTSNGLYISLPSHKVNITRNKIYECQDSAVKIANQQEHGPFTPTDYNLNISNNFIYDAQDYGMEINDLLTSTLTSNTITNTTNFGFYMLRCNNLNVSNNIIAYFTVAFWLEQSNNCTINANSLYGVYPFLGLEVSKLVTSTTNNIINNSINGYIDPNNFYGGDSVNLNTINNNNYSPYLDYNTELSFIKFKMN